jgi:ABC-type phosphate transport system substrate-binding protein
MRKLTKVLTAAACATVVLSLAMMPAAKADPINGSGKAVVPQAYDIVSVGSDSIEFLEDQLTYDYDTTHGTDSVSNPYIYSWNATVPGSVAPGGSITPKAGCKSIARPDGSGAGLTALEQSQSIKYTYYTTKIVIIKKKKVKVKVKHVVSEWCIDYSRSSSAWSASTGVINDGPGGYVWVPLATDGVTYASRDAADGGTNVPSDLTLADLKLIYNCTDTNWSDFGGPNKPIDAYLPQTGSGTRKYFLSAIGVSTAGSCTIDSYANPNHKLPPIEIQENEGLAPVLNDPDGIFPFSIGVWLAQQYRSAACGTTPTAGENKFGCDQNGVLQLNELGAPNAKGVITFYQPTVGSGTRTTTNPDFPLIRTLYDVVRYTSSTKDHIPGYLEPFFASSRAKVKGWFCSSSKASTDILDYGFLLDPAFCGIGS